MTIPALAPIALLLFAVCFILGAVVAEVVDARRERILRDFEQRFGSHPTVVWDRLRRRYDEESR